MKIALIAPCHKQPTQEWIESLPTNIPVFIISDAEIWGNDLKIDKPNIQIFDYKRQEKELREMYPFFAKHFHKSSACKTFGLWYAYKQGFEKVIVIDSDCIIQDKKFILKHQQALYTLKGYGWENTIKEFQGGKYFARGFPYSERNKQIVCNLGLWYGQMDINGIDKISNYLLQKKHKDWHKKKENKIAIGYVPLSGMNLMIDRKAIPGLCFLPNFDYQELKFRRHDDIFGGYIFQKIMKKIGDCLSYGNPMVYHDSGVEPREDAEEEKAMNRWDRNFYKIIDKILDNNYIGKYEDGYYYLDKHSGEFIGTPFEPLIPTFEWFTRLYGE